MDKSVSYVRSVGLFFDFHATSRGQLFFITDCSTVAYTGALYDVTFLRHVQCRAFAPPLSSCHEDPTPFPPCPFLTIKECACGKKVVPNNDLWQVSALCLPFCVDVSLMSSVIIRLLGCGFHQCEQLCHSDDCGSCHAVCGKPRKLW